jgi:hypothetical protein
MLWQPRSWSSSIISGQTLDRNGVPLLRGVVLADLEVLAIDAPQVAVAEKMFPAPPVPERTGSSPK